jgi:hypothetical protein
MAACCMFFAAIARAARSAPHSFSTASSFLFLWISNVCGDLLMRLLAGLGAGRRAGVGLTHPGGGNRAVQPELDAAQPHLIPIPSIQIRPQLPQPCGGVLGF